MPGKKAGTIKGKRTTSSQQKLMGIARGVQKGETSAKYSPQATKIAKTIAPKDLHNIAKKPATGFRK
jgi:hypothetical protein